MQTIALLVLLPLCVPDASPFAKNDDLLNVRPGDVVVAKTPHYEVHLEGALEEAEEYSLLLEDAWGQYKRFLKGAPKRSTKKPVKVKLFATRDEWLEGMEREEEFPPPGTDFIMYSPKRETVFLYRGEEDYWTRKMMLYGAFQQFHFRQRAKNVDLAKSWFVHGLADAFSTHLWDGEVLLLDVSHRFWKDSRARAALSRGVLPKVADGKLTLTDLADVDMRWAMVSFLMRGDGGKHRKRFEKLALGSRGSMLLGHDYAQVLGGEKTLAPALHAWLLEQGHVMNGIWGRWDEEPECFHGERVGDLLHAAAITSDRSVLLEVRLWATPETKSGILLDWDGEGGYLAASVEETLLSIDRWQGDESEQVAEFLLPWPKDGSYLFRAERKGDEVTLTVNRDRPGTFPAFGDRLGLFVAEGRVRFAELSWR